MAARLPPPQLPPFLFIDTVKALDMPARQALVADIVDLREDLPNAIALNSSIFHAARMTGPLLAGALIIPLAAEGACFLLHAIALLGAMICVKRLRPKARMAQTAYETERKTAALFGLRFAKVQKMVAGPKISHLLRRRRRRTITRPSPNRPNSAA